MLFLFLLTLGVEISFSEVSYSGNEGGSFITVTVNKDGDTEFDTSVTLKSSDGTAMGMCQ